MTLPVSTSQDFTLTWSGNGPGTVGLLVVGLSTSSVAIACNVDASMGQLTVPASLMEQLPKGVKGNMGVSLSNSTTMDVGGYAITLNVDTGLIGGGKVSFQ